MTIASGPAAPASPFIVVPMPPKAVLAPTAAVPAPSRDASSCTNHPLAPAASVPATDAAVPTFVRLMASISAAYWRPSNFAPKYWTSSPAFANMVARAVPNSAILSPANADPTSSKASRRSFPFIPASANWLESQDMASVRGLTVSSMLFSPPATLVAASDAFPACDAVVPKIVPRSKRAVLTVLLTVLPISERIEPNSLIAPLACTSR